MNTYLRILSFARPYRRYLPQYLIFAVLFDCIRAN